MVDPVPAEVVQVVELAVGLQLVERPPQVVVPAVLEPDADLDRNDLTVHFLIILFSMYALTSSYQYFRSPRDVACM